MKLLILLLLPFFINTAPPKIQITNPEPATIFLSGDDITITAKTAGQVEYATFIIDNIVLGIDYQKPYTITFNSSGFSLGAHTIQAQAINATGEGAAVVMNIIIQ